MKVITVKGKEYEVIHEFPVMHEGWECDHCGFVVNKNEKPALVLSDHGSFYFAKNKELEEKIAEYREAMKLSKQALVMIYNKKLDIT